MSYAADTNGLPGDQHQNGSESDDLVPPIDADHLVTDAELERALGKTLREVLDLQAWETGAGLEAMRSAIQRFVSSSVENERRWRHGIRTEILDRLPTFPDAPQLAGVYAVQDEHLRNAYRHVLLCGDVAAANGASGGHEGAAASLVAIGICLVQYDGKLQSWRTTFLRNDQPIQGGNLVQEIRDLLDRRNRRSAVGPGSGRDRVTYLLRRGVMAAAERRALLERPTTRWRMGHGMPAPLELLTGSGSMALLDDALPVLQQLLLDNTRWAFLLSPGSNFALATLANTLEEREVAIFQKGKAALDEILDRGHFQHGYRHKVEDFARQLGEATVVGGFRATRHAPGQVFVAHAEHALAAGVLAMADAAMQPHRGFPLLLDLAGVSAKVFLGMEAFQGLVGSAYARAGASHLFAPEWVMS